MNYKVITHRHVDLDACTSAAFLLEYMRMNNYNYDNDYNSEHVFFVSATETNWPIEVDRDAIPVDCALGNKGKGSALNSLQDVRWWLGDEFVDEVHEHDSNGYVQQPRFSLAEIHYLARQGLLAAGVEGGNLDRALISFWQILVRGRIKYVQNKRDALKVIDSCEIVELYGVNDKVFKFVIADGIKLSPAAGMLLQERGVVGCIYKDKDNYNIGVYRFPGFREPDFQRLKKYLPGWFVHSNGFLVAWGSRKAPKYNPPPENTPQTVQEFVELLKETRLGTC